MTHSQRYPLTNHLWIEECLGGRLADIWDNDPLADPDQVSAVVLFRDADGNEMAPPLPWQFPVTAAIAETARYFLAIRHEDDVD